MKKFRSLFLITIICLALIALCSCGKEKEAEKLPTQPDPQSAISQGGTDEKEKDPSAVETKPAVDVPGPVETQDPVEVKPEDKEPEKTQKSVSSDILMSGADPDKLKWNEDGTKILSPDVPEYDFSEAPEGYFDTALFIGDSRSVGLAHYGKIEGPHYFVDTGLSIYNFTKSTVNINGVGKVKLTNLFDDYVYDKVYIGLGINELGYPYNGIEKKFNDLLEIVKTYEPDATIYLMANIHVTKKRSDSDNVYNNSRINTLNTMLRDIAEADPDDKIYYIDCNPLFDDGEGNLNQDMTFDNTHLLAKHYPEWADFIRTHVVL